MGGREGNRERERVGWERERERKRERERVGWEIEKELEREEEGEGRERGPKHTYMLIQVYQKYEVTRRATAIC